MKKHVLVLGAGMIGTCTALQLVLRGHSVVLLDRGAPGRETSYGNAGVIQCDVVDPTQFPQDMAMLARVALKRGAEVNYHLGTMPSLVPVLSRFWRNSRGTRYEQIAREYSQLIVRSLTEHMPLIAMAGADDLVRRGGYRFVFRSQPALDQYLTTAQRYHDVHGVNYQPMDSGQLATAEPSLRQRLAGAIHWTDPWSITDPGALVQRYADLFVARGGSIARGDALTLKAVGSGWQVMAEGGPLQAEHAVIALGPWADQAITRLGYHFPLFIKRGYHRHYTGAPGPNLSLVDAERGYVIAPMQRGVRLTTGAEFARIDAAATPVQMDKVEVLARELMDLPHPVESEPWLGARPCTGDLKPVIGAAPRHKGLWLHFGHAHQGFTMGAVSGRLLAELMDGDRPIVDPVPYLPERFM